MTESSSAGNTCPKCGAALPSAATAGLCPRCLMAEAMVPTQSDAESPPPRPTLSPAELAPHFPQLEILECLGRGGMGVVYKARQKLLNRLVALKLLAPERVADAKFAERFTHEAQALAALNHPSIVTIHDFGQAGGFYFLLMEFVDGVNFRQAMKVGHFTPEQALAIVPPICDALQCAHEHGIVHRDIKPENLLLDKEGRVKIADFGIAKMLGTDGAPLTRPEGTLSPSDGERDGVRGHDDTLAAAAGTPQYMAPEQQEHRAADHRADIYSLGVVLYELLTGELPADKLQPPSRKVQIDVRLDEIVLRALEVKPELRYQTAAELRTQVETVASTPPPVGGPASAGPPPPRTAINPPFFVEQEGRRRLDWPGVLLLCGTIGVTVLVINLAIALMFWLVTGQPWPMFQPRELPWVLVLMAACAVMRLAAVKLGAGVAARPGAAPAAPAAPVGPARKVIVGFLVFALAAAMAAGVALVSFALIRWTSAKTPPRAAAASASSRPMAPSAPLAKNPAATNQTWSPKFTADVAPDLDAIFSEAQGLKARGRYEDALQRHLWLHHHGLESGPAYSAVRLSFWLSDWIELARRFPRAKQALIEIRDHKARELEANRGYFDLFMDVNSINLYLQEEAATLALFKRIERSDPQLAKQCAMVMKPVPESLQIK